MALQAGVLRFGDFVLKSGRRSPYFFNTGLFNTGRQLSRLGSFYAAAVSEAGLEFDMLYGPAYKGIPLVCATALALAEEHDRDIPYCFNRKEAKHHGEGGIIVGAPLSGRVLIVDDVISAGTSVRESQEIIAAGGATAVGVCIALDRQERGQGRLSAVQEVQEGLGLRVSSIVSLAELIAYLEEREEDAELLARVREYQCEYGVAATQG